MLNDMSLSGKLTVALEWFRRARSGEFTLDGPKAAKFLELLDDCREIAADQEATETEVAVVEGEALAAYAGHHVDEGEPLLVRFPDGRMRDPLGVAAKVLQSDRGPIDVSVDDVRVLAFAVCLLAGVDPATRGR